MRRKILVKILDGYPYSILETKFSYKIEGSISNIVRVQFYCKKNKFISISEVVNFAESNLRRYRENLSISKKDYSV